MAAVARDQQLNARMDAFLEYCLREWESLPQVASEWEAWGSLERLEFVMEWPLREDRLGQLREHARQGHLTASQRRQFKRLQQLVAEHEPRLECLLTRSR